MNPFDTLATEAIAEYWAGQTRPLRVFAKEIGLMQPTIVCIHSIHTAWLPLTNGVEKVRLVEVMISPDGFYDTPWEGPVTLVAHKGDDLQALLPAALEEMKEIAARMAN